jgi:hypothetical protein
MNLSRHFWNCFWKTGLSCLAVVTVALVTIYFTGPDAPIGAFFSPFVLLLYQIPCFVFVQLMGLLGVQGFLPRNLWIVLPFLAVLVFCWNGLVGGGLGMAWHYLRKIWKFIP